MPAYGKQRKTTPTQPLHFHIKFVCMPYQFSIYRVYFFNIYSVIWSNIRKSLGAEKADKLVNIY